MSDLVESNNKDENEIKKKSNDDEEDVSQPKQQEQENEVNETDIIKKRDEDDLNAATNKTEEVAVESKEQQEQEQEQQKSPTNLNQQKRADDTVYCLKWIDFNNKSVPIILQNENGPCPLIAIANILFLKQIIKFNSRVEYVTSKNLMEYLGDALFRFKPATMKSEDELNFNQNFSDALNLLHRLEFGCDVNIKFTGTKDFEYTTEMNIFDIFNINMYHGWLVDPQQVEIAEIIGNLSYNQLVEKIIFLKNSDSQVDVARGMQVEEFLDATQSQLTYHGLIELQSALKPNELAVFFRNNHFSTIYKHNDRLYLLATDQGFLQRSSIVWETLSNIDGDIEYCNSYFRITQNADDAPSGGAVASAASAVPPKNTNDTQNISLSETADFMYAMSLQTQMDEQYATMLQEEEKRRTQQEEQQLEQRQQQQQQQRQQQQAQSQQQQRQAASARQHEGKSKKKDSCLIM